MQNLPMITIMKIPATLTFQSKIQQRINRAATACFPLIPVTGAEAKPEEDESEEDSSYWNIHGVHHTGAGKADVDTRQQRDSPPTLSALPSRIKDRLLALSSICIFRFLPLLIVLAEVVKLIGILYEGCKIWYLIAGHSTFQVPTFSCPQHQQSIRYDAAELLHDWLCGAEDSAGEATARALALTLATAATSSSLAAAPPPRRHSSSLESPSLL